MKNILLFTSILLFFANLVNAQLFLQLEKAGSFKVERFVIGDEITFKLKGDPNFRTEYIEDIIPEENIIVFSNGMAKVEQIEAIRDYEWGAGMRAVGRNLYLFAAAWALYSIADLFFGDPITILTTAAIVIGSALLTGWLLRKIFRYKTHRFKKRKRLRILDLRIDPSISA